MGELLEKLGYRNNGTEQFYSGSNGAPLKGYVYTGPVYY